MPDDVVLCLLGSLLGAVLDDGEPDVLEDEPVPEVPDEPVPDVPLPEAPPLMEPETEVLLEPGVEAVAEVVSVGEVELDDDEVLGDVEVLPVLLGDDDEVEPDVEPLLPELPERSQPTTAAEARARAATTGMSLFMNFSNQDRLSFREDSRMRETSETALHDACQGFRL